MIDSRPERLIYLIDCDSKRQLTCEFLLTRLLNWKHFQPAPINRIQELFHSTFRKYLRAEDRKILMRLQYWENPNRPVASIAGAEAFELLREIAGLGRAFLKDGNQLRMKWGDERDARPRWAEDPNGRWLTHLDVEPAATAIVAAEPPCYLDRETNTAGPLQSPFSPALAGAWLKAGPMSQSESRAFCLRLMNRFPDESVPLPGSTGANAPGAIEPRIRLRVFRRDADRELAPGHSHSLQEIALLQVVFFYGPRKVEWDSDAATIAFEENGEVRRCARDKETEERDLDILKNLGFRPAAGPESDTLFHFHAADFELAAGAPVTWQELLDKEFPRLRRERQWKIAFDPSLNLVPSNQTQWFAKIERAPKSDWFSFDAGLEFEGKRIPVLDIVRALLRSRRDLPQPELIEYCRRTSFTVPIDEGKRLLVVPGERIAGLVKTLFELRLNRDDDTIRIGAWRASELADEGIADVENDALVARLQHLRENARNGLELSPIEDLPTLPIVPREYQRIGLAWLDFLREYDFHGILADDMGLGKTMQVLVHVLREKERGGLDGPALIVAPTSVLGAWESEKERFTPSLKMVRFHGADRELPGDGFAGADIVVTSYALARIDAARLDRIEWSLLVLDEAQRIKNPDSDTARSLCRFASRRRLCLTGTPIENHLGELWSLFHFLMPGFLGDRRSFNETFRAPAEGEDAALAREAASSLAKRIHPFILRRKKDQVARELPPRTEIVRKIRLTPKQTEIYESVRLRMHGHIAAELEKRGVAGSQIAILDALLKLRQVCCDPRLNRNLPKRPPASDSAKLTTLVEMLESLLDEGRRVLVFSQFVSMLDLIAAELRQRKWPFLTLTGETADRDRVVESFQNEKSPILLISLKAGGSGLTLTAADTVIQYDPWWNPAVEQQAADRVYRIGQDKPVFLYRLIAEGTVEEKILDLHSRKQALIDSILEGVPSGSSLIDEETIEALLG